MTYHMSLYPWLKKTDLSIFSPNKVATGRIQLWNEYTTRLCLNQNGTGIKYRGPTRTTFIGISLQISAICWLACIQLCISSVVGLWNLCTFNLGFETQIWMRTRWCFWPWPIFFSFFNFFYYGFHKTMVKKNGSSFSVSFKVASSNCLTSDWGRSYPAWGFMLERFLGSTMCWRSVCGQTEQDLLPDRWLAIKWLWININVSGSDHLFMVSDKNSWHILWFNSYIKTWAVC